MSQIQTQFNQGVSLLFSGNINAAGAIPHFKWITGNAPAENDGWRALAACETITSDEVASDEIIRKIFDTLHSFGSLIRDARTSSGQTFTSADLLPVKIGLPLFSMDYRATTKAEFSAAYAAVLIGDSDYETAASILDRLDDDLPVVQIVRASLYYNTKRWGDVIDVALRLQNSTNEAGNMPVAEQKQFANVLLMESWARLGESDTALSYYADAVGKRGYAALVKMLARGHYIAGLVFRSRGEDDASNEALGQALAADPGDEDIEAAKQDDHLVIVATTRDLINERTDPWDYTTEPKLAERKSAEVAAAKGDMLAEAEEELARQIGMESVKDAIHRLKSSVRVQQKKAALGLKVEKRSNHLIFTGPPGTGKTTMARVVAKIYCGLGILPSDKVIETSRTDFVGKYMGHSADKTRETVRSAMGGVLFIDEAYTLISQSSGSGDQFGEEAVGELLTGIENNRDNLVVILAGYHDDMEEFLAFNPGMKSRFPREIEFQSYSASEIYDIIEVIAKSRGFSIAPDAREYIVSEISILNNYDTRNRRFMDVAGNGRFARNMEELAEERMEARLGEADDSEFENFNETTFTTLTLPDLQGAWQQLRGQIIAPPE